MKTGLRHAVLMAAAIALSIAGEGRAGGHGKNKVMAACVTRVRTELPDLDLDHRPRAFSKDELQFLHFYGLDLKGCVHYFGWRTVDGRRLATHVYVPPTASGTVLVSHGYFDHAGVWRNVLPRLVSAGFRVVIYDQPGHGLSDGARATIADFTEYTSALKSFVDLCRTQFDGPLHLVAHSMGGTAVVDYLLTARRSPPVDRIVLLAPLCRSKAWHLAKFGYAITHRWIKHVPRKYRPNSGDKAFLKFVRADPLQSDTVPLQWVGALEAWNKRVMTYKPLPTRPMLIIQGSKDSVVDAAYNIRLLQRRFPMARVVTVAGAGHQLFNETPALREQTLRLIIEELTRKGK